MKFLLLIPVVALFLSNVPFKLEMSMPSDAGEESCPMDQQEMMKCSSDESPKEEGCCKKESTCVCFYGFQLLAPAQHISKFSFQVPKEKSLHGLYLQLRWNNPFIAGPLQPPDVG
jgi:hypothetical protein